MFLEVYSDLLLQHSNLSKYLYTQELSGPTVHTTCQEKNHAMRHCVGEGTDQGKSVKIFLMFDTSITVTLLRVGYLAW